MTDPDGADRRTTSIDVARRAGVSQSAVSSTTSITLNGEVTEGCRAAGIPVMLVNRRIAGSGRSTVTSASRAGGARVAEVVVAGGQRRIAPISGWLGASTGRDRRDGVVPALHKAGRTLHAEADGLFNREVAARIAREMMSAPEPPDAIFAGTDYMAMAVLDILRHQVGMGVPDDVPFVGPDDGLPAGPSHGADNGRHASGRDRAGARAPAALSKSREI